MSSKHLAGWRVGLFVFAVFVLAGVLGYRIFNLSLIKHDQYLKTAEQQYSNPTALAGRGNIYFSDGHVLAATNRTEIFLYSNNKLLVDSPPILADKLSVLINQPKEILTAKLAEPGKSYQVLAENITQSQANEIKKLKIKGITTVSGLERFYPLGPVAAQTLGFVGYDGDGRAGKYGIEAKYDETLRGADVVLSIDKNIQELIESKLNAVLKKWNSPAGSIIVENPKTGEILGMASSPSYDPNRYSDYDFSVFINPLYQELYEPGSSFKPITMSAAIDTGAVTPETTYTDSGEVKIGSYTIRNYDEKAHGVQTMRQVLEHSLNTGVIFAQEKTGDDPFLNFVVNFGFGQKSGIDLNGEISGNIANLYSGRKINFYTASYGQGIAVTPLQLINAYSSIANGGKLLQPHLVKQIISKDGKITQIKSKIISSPIKEDTAKKIQSMLVDVVDKGFDKARVAGYDIAGKTGTAQIPSPSGGYLENDQFIHNFVGFAPAYDAQFVVLIKIDRPKGIKFAADSLSPVFGDIAKYLLRYLNIAPTRQ